MAADSPFVTLKFRHGFYAQTITTVVFRWLYIMWKLKIFLKWDSSLLFLITLKINRFKIWTLAISKPHFLIIKAKHLHKKYSIWSAYFDLDDEPMWFSFKACLHMYHGQQKSKFFLGKYFLEIIAVEGGDTHVIYTII